MTRGRVAPPPPATTRTLQRPAATTATTLPRQAATTLATVDPAIWGPPLWRVLHTLAEHTGTAWPATRGNCVSTAWPALLNALKTDIPCPDCRRHFTAWLRTHPYTLTPPHRRRYIMVDRKRVLAPPPQAADPQTYTRQWFLDLHNDVNRRNRKAPWNAEQVRDANQSLDAARAALQSLAGLIGPTAYAQLAAMMPPADQVQQPLLVVEETKPEDQVQQPLLVVEETQPDNQVQPVITEQPLLVVEETQPDNQVQPVTTDQPEDQVKPEDQVQQPLLDVEEESAPPYDPVAATTIMEI